MFWSASSAAGVSVGGQAAEEPAAAQEPVEHLAGRPLVGELGVAAQVASTSRCDGRPGLGRDAQDPGLALELVEDRPDRAVAAAGHVDDRGQVLAAEPVRPRRPPGRTGRRSTSRSATTRRKASSSRTSGRAYSPEVPENRHGMPAMFRRAQDRVGVGVGADEDRVVARARRRPRSAGRSRRRSSPPPPARREDLEPDRGRRRRRPAPAGGA